MLGGLTKVAGNVSLAPSSDAVSENTKLEGTKYHPLFLEVNVRKSEGDLEGFFLTSGGSLGSATGRFETDFAVSGAKESESYFLTHSSQKLRIPLPEECATLVLDAKSACVQISDRARLNITTTRMGAGINGSIVQTMSGQGSVSLMELLTQSVETGFMQADLSYPNWPDASAVLAFASTKVVDEEGDAFDVRIVQDLAYNSAMKKSESVITDLYNASWKLRENVVYQPSPHLTKPVYRVALGQGWNGSGYELGSRINDRPFLYGPEVLDRIIETCVGLEYAFDADAMSSVLKEIESGRVEAVVKHGREFASALSTMAAYLNPYRVDGRAVIMPDGAKMGQSESWYAESPRTAFSADDCDGSAALIVSAIQLCESASAANPGKFKHLDAMSGIVKHYVYGTSVLGANAGHADAADENAASIAGHACAIMVPKARIAASMASAHELGVGGAPGPAIGTSHSDSIFEALYPSSVVGSICESDRADFSSFASLSKSKFSDPVSGLQPLAMEGTTAASASMYKHDHDARRRSQRLATEDKKLTSEISPNMSRSIKSLDTGESGDHSFYSEFVELTLPTNSGLFSATSVRKAGIATAHLVFAKPGSGAVSDAGASPRRLATGDFVSLPLWTVTEQVAEAMDFIFEEAASNSLPRRRMGTVLSELQSNNTKQSLDVLRQLGVGLSSRSAASRVHCSQHLFSFAALTF